MHWGKLAALAALALPNVCAAEAANEFGVAVVIGNKAYQDERVPDVDYAHNDADAFYQFVVRTLGFSPDNVVDLRDATKARMESAFGSQGNVRGQLWRWAEADGSSDIVVFYSGHGVPGLNDGRGYLLPVDANPDTAEINGYPIDVLYENLGKVPHKSATVFLDACFSGSSGDGGRLIAGASPVYVEADVSGVAGLTVLTAASGKQLASWDTEARHGLFTEHLLEALYGAADADSNGRVSAAETKLYLDRHMTRAARRNYGREQDASLHGDESAVLSFSSTGGWGSRPTPGLPPAAFTVAVEPADARVRILNIRPPYRAGMELAAGSYQVEASAPGYVTKADMVAHGTAPTVHRMALSRPGQPFTIVPEPTQARVRLVDQLETYQPGMLLPLGSYRVEASAEGYVTTTATVAHGAEPTTRRIVLRKARSQVGDRFQDCPECPQMVVLPAGSYRMGSQNNQHEVAIGAPFALGRYEVTFAEWDACARDRGCPRGEGIAEDSGGWGRGPRPVINVSWDHAKRYVRWLSRKTAKPYRLPSESEWEYAARAGTETAYSWGDEIGVNRANCRRCGSQWDRSKTAPVGSFGANTWGLHDMHGNVWEWVEDCWNRSYAGSPVDGGAWLTGKCDRRVLRGGSWYSFRRNLRAAARDWNIYVVRGVGIGFRVARTLSPP